MTTQPRVRKQPRLAIPSFSDSTQSLIELSGNPEATVRDYARIVIDDPGLSTTVLKLVNSALYGLPNRVVTIRDACVLLGLRNLNVICLSAALAGEMKNGPSQIVSSCWAYSLSTGHIARRLAATIDPQLETQQFLAGLLHAIGIIALLGSPDAEYDEVIAEAREDGCDWAEVERRHYGFDHGVVASDIIRRWKLPEPVSRLAAAVVRDPESDSQDVWCLSVASALTQRRDPSFVHRAHLDQTWQQLEHARERDWRAVEPHFDELWSEAELQRKLLQ